MKRHKYALNGLKTECFVRKKTEESKVSKMGLERQIGAILWIPAQIPQWLGLYYERPCNALRTLVYFNGKYKEIQVRGINLRSFPGGSGSKKSSCKAEDQGLIPGSERSPAERNVYPLQNSCLQNSMEKGA